MQTLQLTEAVMNCRLALDPAWLLAACMGRRQSSGSFHCERQEAPTLQPGITGCHIHNKGSSELHTPSKEHRNQEHEQRDLSNNRERSSQQIHRASDPEGAQCQSDRHAVEDHDHDSNR